MSMIKKCLGSGSGISKLQPGKLRPEARHGGETEIGATQASHGVWTPPSTVGWWTPSTWASPRSPCSPFSSPWPPVCVGGSRWGGGGLLFSKKPKHSSIKTVFSEILFFFLQRNHVSSPLLRVVRGLEWISSSQSLGKRAAASRASSSAIWWENTWRLTSVHFLIWLITINHNRKSSWLIMINWDTANQWLPTFFGLWSQVNFTNCWQFLTTSGTFFFFFWQKSCKPNLYWLCFQINPETGVLEEENLTPCRRLSAFLGV